MIEVRAMDHIVLRVADVERSLAWYSEMLGLDPVRVEEWRAGECPFPSVRISDDTIIDLITGGADLSKRNLDHFCLVVTPQSLETVRAANTFNIVRDPDTALFGARGYANGLYIADPDGNEIELRAYPHDLHERSAESELR